MLANYFFIDGSALTSQIRLLWKKEANLAGRKLNCVRFIDHLRDNLHDLGSNEFKRAIFYFPAGDEVGIEEYLTIPKFSAPGVVRDLHIKFCGEKLKKSTGFDKFVEDTVPEKWRDRFQKSEKGVDIEICCDALRLASGPGMERLFFFTNDDDFRPLFRALKDFGVNVSLIHLSERTKPNASLLLDADSYDVVVADQVDSLFDANGDQSVDSSMPVAEVEEVPKAISPIDPTANELSPEEEPSETK